MTADDGKVKEVPFAEHARARQEAQAEIAAVNWLLAHLAEALPPGSPAARAIGRGAAWTEIEALARWEGAEEIVALLEDAGRTLGPGLPAATGVLDRSEEASSLRTNPVPLMRGARSTRDDDNEHPPGDQK